MKFNRELSCYSLCVAMALSSVHALAESSDKNITEPRAGEASKTQVDTAGSKPTTDMPKPASTDIVKHKPVTSIATGERLLVKAKLNTKDGIDLARVYFKSSASEQYNFVVLNETGRNVYSAELPAVGTDIAAVEYKIVFKDALGEVYKTDKFSVGVIEGAASTVALTGFVDVFSEYPEDKAENLGFSDTVRYSYSAAELVTNSGYVANVASPGAGYIGASSSAAGSAGGTVATGAASSSASAASGSAAAAGAASGGAGAATVATAAASSSGAAAAATTASVLPIAAATGGAAAVAVAVSSDDSSTTTDSNCFSRIVEYTTIESDIEVTQWVEFSEGVPERFSVYNSVTGCQEDLTGVNVQFSEADRAEYQESCITEELIVDVYEEAGIGANSSYQFVDEHGCPVTFSY